MPGLRLLCWWVGASLLPAGIDQPSVHDTTLATCRAAFVHPARVADLVFEVAVGLDHFDEEVGQVEEAMQGMRDEWQAELAGLQLARVGGSGEVHLITRIE